MGVLTSVYAQAASQQRDSSEQLRLLLTALAQLMLDPVLRQYQPELQERRSCAWPL